MSFCGESHQMGQGSKVKSPATITAHQHNNCNNVYDGVFIPFPQQDPHHHVVIQEMKRIQITDTRYTRKSRVVE